MISETIELLGKGVYTDIPNVLTLTNLPTSSELEYVGSEDFDKTMVESILPACIEEKINVGNLLELDYLWVCRCLRLLNFGPYHTTNAIFCKDCDNYTKGEFQVNLNTIECIPLPDGFVNELVITKDEFVDFEGDIVFKLPTIRETMNYQKDTAFQLPNGFNRTLAKLCYTIKSIKGKTNFTPIELKMFLQKELSAADYIILKNKVSEMSDYGLRAGGAVQCPKCGSINGRYVAFPDDRFFRPTVGNLKQWKYDRSKGSN